MIPTRKAPALNEALSKINNKETKKPPPRPPPPNFSKVKSKSSWNLQDNLIDLFDWSPPSSPKKTHTHFGGSISSSFSSSSSSLTSTTKKNFEIESLSSWFPKTSTASQQSQVNTIRGAPTIIRPQPKKTPKAKVSTLLPDVLLPASGSLAVVSDDCEPPMPKVPPPSPPKVVSSDVIEPFGIALYKYKGEHPDDLSLQVNDIVYLIRKVNDDWMYGRVEDKEGLFPSTFVEVQVPLQADDKWVTALYDFTAQEANDLSFKKGDRIRITGRASKEWLIGECNGKAGHLPCNFIDRVPIDM